MWNFYEWSTEEEFNIWHDAIRKRLNYPLAGYIQATGELDESAPLTTEYTSVKLVQDKYIGQVEESEAEGLALTDLRPPLPIELQA